MTETDNFHTVYVCGTAYQSCICNDLMLCLCTVHPAAGLPAFPEDTTATSSSEQTLPLSPEHGRVVGSSRGGTARPRRKQISFDDYHVLWKGLATSQPVSRKGNPCELCTLCRAASMLSCWVSYCDCEWVYLQYCGVCCNLCTRCIQSLIHMYVLYVYLTPHILMKSWSVSDSMHYYVSTSGSDIVLMIFKWSTYSRKVISGLCCFFYLIWCTAYNWYSLWGIHSLEDWHWRNIFDCAASFGLLLQWFLCWCMTRHCTRFTWVGSKRRNRGLLRKSWNSKLSQAALLHGVDGYLHKSCVVDQLL